jgi:hypothetical protein
MTDLIVVPQMNEWHRLKFTRAGQRLVADHAPRVQTSGSMSSSPGTTRSPKTAFTKTTVDAWRFPLKGRAAERWLETMVLGEPYAVSHLLSHLQTRPAG